MKIAFSTLSCPRWDLQTVLERAAEYGYDGVDFRGLGEQMDVSLLPEFTDHAEQTAATVAAAGLEVPCFSSGAKMFQPDEQAHKQDLLEIDRLSVLCRRFGARFIRVFGGDLRGTDPDAAIATAANTLKELATAAGPDVTIGVETHDDWVRTDLLARVFDRAAASNVCVVWDLHHPYRLAGETAATTAANIGALTGYVHVKDGKVGPDGQKQLTLPGEGDVPLVEMIGLLAQMGYDGWLTVEWEKRWQKDIAEPEQALPAYREYLREVLAAVASGGSGS